MQHNDLFKEYYRKVATGPGIDWKPYRRARFTLQVMIDRDVSNGP